MLARVNIGGTPGIPVILTEEDFRGSLYRINGEHTYCINSEAVEWSKYGRLGTHWQVDNVMYIKIKDGHDDPFQYYTPPDTPKNSGKGGILGDSYCGGNKGNCGKTGCSC